MASLLQPSERADGLDQRDVALAELRELEDRREDLTQAAADGSSTALRAAAIVEERISAATRALTELPAGPRSLEEWRVEADHAKERWLFGKMTANDVSSLHDAVARWATSVEVERTGRGKFRASIRLTAEAERLQKHPALVEWKAIHELPEGGDRDLEAKILADAIPEAEEVFVARWVSR